MASDAAPPEPAPAAAVPPAAGDDDPVLLQGHLHPAVLILRLVEGLRQAVLFTVLGVVANRWLLVAAAVVFLVHLGHGLARYLTFQYRLTRSELVTREGILNRQERRIPIDRVQDLGFESTLLRRFLGLAIVRVETASGTGYEAVLDSLGRPAAEHLREVLLALRQQNVVDADAAAVDGGPPVQAAPVPEWRVFAADGAQLLLRGLTDLRFGAVVVAGAGAIELLDQLGMMSRVRGATDDLVGWLERFPMAMVVGILALVVAVIMALSVVASALGNLMLFHGFVLSLRADTLLCRYGLLTTRQKTLPRRRVQRVRLEQTWLRRLLGLGVARADSAGANTLGRPTDAAASGLDVVVPLAPLGQIEALLPALLPGLENGYGPVRGASTKLIWRTFLKGALWLLLPAVAAPWLGPWAFAPMLLLPLPWLVGRLAWQNFAWGLWEQHLYLQWGLLGRYRVVLPTSKVQAVAVRAGPLQRLLGLGNLSVFVAGGAPTCLPDLPIGDALPLQRALAVRATAAAAADWSQPDRRTAAAPAPAEPPPPRV